LDPINTELSPVQQFKKLHQELKKYDISLLEKNIFVAVNKCEIFEDSKPLLEELGLELSKLNIRNLYPISAVTSLGVKKLLEKIYSSFN
jgi:GTP-binding protein